MPPVHPGGDVLPKTDSSDDLPFHLDHLDHLDQGCVRHWNVVSLCDPGEASRSGLTRITRTDPEALGRRSTVAGCPGAAQGFADFPGFTELPAVPTVPP